MRPNWGLTGEFTIKFSRTLFGLSRLEKNSEELRYGQTIGIINT